MNFVSARLSLGVLVAAGLMAACGAPSTAPAIVSNAAAIRNAAPAAHRYDCGLPHSAPGAYVLMQSQGLVKGAGYRSFVGIWELGQVSPTTEPSPSSEPSPPGTPVYVYVGKYKLSNIKQTGCAYLVTSQDGKPLVGTDNGTLDGTPWFGNSPMTMKATTGGKLRALASLTSSGGYAQFDLYNANGSVVDKATATFAQRIATTDLKSLANYRGLAPNYAFSCDPARYLYKTVQSAKPGTARGFGFEPKYTGHNYVDRFAFCSVDNSLLTASDVASTQTYSFAHGTVTYRLEATFNPSVAWANNPDVAVWEEAYRYDGTREPAADIHLALVRVR